MSQQGFASNALRTGFETRARVRPRLNRNEGTPVVQNRLPSTTRPAPGSGLRGARRQRVRPLETAEQTRTKERIRTASQLRTVLTNLSVVKDRTYERLMAARDAMASGVRQNEDYKIAYDELSSVAKDVSRAVRDVIKYDAYLSNLLDGKLRLEAAYLASPGDAQITEALRTVNRTLMARYSGLAEIYDREFLINNAITQRVVSASDAIERLDELAVLFTIERYEGVDDMPETTAVLDSVEKALAGKDPGNPAVARQNAMTYQAERAIGFSKEMNRGRTDVSTTESVRRASKFMNEGINRLYNAMNGVVASYDQTRASSNTLNRQKRALANAANRASVTGQAQPRLLPMLSERALAARRVRAAETAARAAERTMRVGRSEENASLARRIMQAAREADYSTTEYERVTASVDPIEILNRFANDRRNAEAYREDTGAYATTVLNAFNEQVEGFRNSGVDAKALAAITRPEVTGLAERLAATTAETDVKERRDLADRLKNELDDLMRYATFVQSVNALDQEAGGFEDATYWTRGRFDEKEASTKLASAVQSYGRKMRERSETEAATRARSLFEADASERDRQLVEASKNPNATLETFVAIAERGMSAEAKNIYRAKVEAERLATGIEAESRVTDNMAATDVERDYVKTQRALNRPEASIQRDLIDRGFAASKVAGLYALAEDLSFSREEAQDVIERAKTDYNKARRDLLALSAEGARKRSEAANKAAQDRERAATSNLAKNLGVDEAAVRRELGSSATEASVQEGLWQRFRNDQRIKSTQASIDATSRASASASEAERAATDQMASLLGVKKEELDVLRAKNKNDERAVRVELGQKADERRLEEYNKVLAVAAGVSYDLAKQATKNGRDLTQKIVDQMVLNNKSEVRHQVDLKDLETKSLLERLERAEQRAKDDALKITTLQSQVAISATQATELAEASSQTTSALQLKVAELQAANERLRTEALANVKTNDTSSAQLATLNTKLAQLEAENVRLQNELSTSKSAQQNEEAGKAEDERKADEEIQRLRRDNEAIQNANDRYKTQLASLQKQRDDLATENRNDLVDLQNQLKQALEALEVARQRSTEEARQATLARGTDLDNLQKEYKLKEQELERSVKAQTELQLQQIKALEAQVTSLAAQRVADETTIARQAENLQKQTELAQNRAKELESSRQALAESEAALKTRLSELEIQRTAGATNAEAIAALNLQITNLKADQSKNQESINSNATETARLKKLQEDTAKQLKDAQDQVDLQRRAMEESAKKTKQLNTELTALQDRYDKRESTYKEFSTAVASITSVVDEAEVDEETRTEIQKINNDQTIDPLLKKARVLQYLNRAAATVRVRDIVRFKNAAEKLGIDISGVPESQLSERLTTNLYTYADEEVRKSKVRLMIEYLTKNDKIGENFTYEAYMAKRDAITKKYDNEAFKALRAKNAAYTYEKHLAKRNAEHKRLERTYVETVRAVLQQKAVAINLASIDNLIKNMTIDNVESVIFEVDRDQHEMLQIEYRNDGSFLAAKIRSVSEQADNPNAKRVPMSTITQRNYDVVSIDADATRFLKENEGAKLVDLYSFRDTEAVDLVEYTRVIRSRVIDQTLDIKWTQTTFEDPNDVLDLLLRGELYDSLLDANKRRVHEATARYNQSNLQIIHKVMATLAIMVRQKGSNAEMIEAYKKINAVLPRYEKNTTNANDLATYVTDEGIQIGSDKFRREALSPILGFINTYANPDDVMPTASDADRSEYRKGMRLLQRMMTKYMKGSVPRRSSRS